jgi:adenosylhomocysteine nucleosidase
MQKIKNNFPTAMALDMESAAVAQTCYLYNTPLLVIKQISDVPGAENHAEQYAEFWKNAPQNSINMLHNILDIL